MRDNMPSMEYFAGIFGDRSRFAAEIAIEVVAERAFVDFSYWVLGQRHGTNAAIDVFDACASFAEMRNRVLGGDRCDLFEMDPVDVIQEYHCLVNSPDESLDIARLETMRGGSLWFHHSLGDIYLFAVSCAGRSRVIVASADNVIPAVIDLSVDEVATAIECCGDALSLAWAAQKAKSGE